MVRLIALRLAETYFRHRWLYLLPILLMLVLSIVYFTVLADRVFVVRGVLYVQPDTLLSSLTSLDSEAGFASASPAEYTANEVDELLQTDSFVRSLISRTRLETHMNEGPLVVEEMIDEVRDDVWVEEQGKNQLMVAAAHEDPMVAYELSNALVESYVQWRINADQRESATARDFFTGLIATYQQDLDAARNALRDYLEAHPAPVFGDRPASEELEIERLRSAVDLAQSRYSSVLEKEESARLALTQVESNVRHTYFLIDAPSVPVRSATSVLRIVRNVAIFTTVGVFLSVLALIGAALIDRAPRFPIDLERETGIPVLAMIPAADPTPPGTATTVESSAPAWRSSEWLRSTDGTATD